MSVIINFNVEQSDNAKEFRFTETTGIYHVTDNVGGWGSPNEVVGDAVTVELTVTDPDGTATTLDLSSNFPATLISTVEYIQSDDLGGTADTKLADGVWTFTYTVITGTTTYTNTQYIFVSGQTRCCVYKMLCSVDPCQCNGASLARALEAYTYYRMAVACALCGNETKFEELLEIIDTYCADCCS
jgi:hypothetical protein